MKFIYWTHALIRLFQRQININDIREIIEHGETIEDYPLGYPFPSKLMLGWSNRVPIHIVVATDPTEDQMIIVTGYRPDRRLWSDDFRKRLE